MFERRHTSALVLALALALVGLLTARPSSGAASEQRHVVEQGETLWGIAAEHYGGDPRAGIWRIERRNALAGGPLQPGTVLYLPG